MFFEATTLKQAAGDDDTQKSRIAVDDVTVKDSEERGNFVQMQNLRAKPWMLESHGYHKLVRSFSFYYAPPHSSGKEGKIDTHKISHRTRQQKNITSSSIDWVTALSKPLVSCLQVREKISKRGKLCWKIIQYSGALSKFIFLFVRFESCCAVCYFRSLIKWILYLPRVRLLLQIKCDWISPDGV